MNKTFALYSKIMDELLDKNESLRFYFQSPYGLYDCEDISEIFTFSRADVGMYFGATRGTIVCDECDEVVKFDLDTCLEDNCNIELNIYGAAVDAGLNKCFAPVRYLGTYQRTVHTWPIEMFGELDYDDSVTEDKFNMWVEELGLRPEDRCDIVISISFYAYTKAYNIGIDCPECNPDDNHTASSYNSPLMERYDHIGASFVHEYGEAFYAALSAFLNEWNVNDIHYGNIGWIGSYLVLIDYAGYRC